MSLTVRRKGPIDWMARHPVAANLLMLLCIVGGLLQAFRVKQEVFPAFERDMIRVTVPYPGAGPAEVEQGIVLAVEEAVRGIDGVKRVVGRAEEGRAVVDVELLADADDDRALTDVKNAVDRVRSLPEEAERPTISEVVARRHVISIILHGDLPPDTLRALAERTRSDLTARTDITQVELSHVPPREIAIEVPPAILRAHGLTLEEVANVVRAASIELPGGSVHARGGELLVRTAERRDLGAEFADIIVRSNTTRTPLRLGDIARVVDGFAETNQETTFDGEPAIKLDVFRVGDQTPIEVADAVRAYLAEVQFPPGVSADTWDDQSQAFRERIDLMERNAALGLVLVFLVLGLFLEIKVAFWVMMGIPISFLGSFLLLPALGVSINMISLFAFIIVLGIVVDDAIVVGENVFELRRQGVPAAEAAIEGARQVAVPVFFSVATTIAAFGPLFFVPGFIGKVFSVIPFIVISVLVVSLVESMFILPAHLMKISPVMGSGVLGWIHRHQAKVSRGLERFVQRVYVPFARQVVSHRYLTATIALVVLLLSAISIRTGLVEFSFMPRIESDVVIARARLPVGAPLEDSRAVRDELVAAAEQALDRLGGDGLRRGVYAQVGRALGDGGPVASTPQQGSHIVEVALQLVPVDRREVTAEQIAAAWRAAAGALPGLETLAFDADGGPSAGKPIDIQLSHADSRVLEAAATRLAAEIATFAGVLDVDPGFSNGKEQLDLKLKPAARALGLTEADLAKQIRGAFYGAEALRYQRGRDEVKVLARLPREDRERRAALEGLVVRTPQGGEIPLAQAARLEPGRADTAIRRVDGRRVLEVTANIDAERANANKIVARVEAEVLPGLIAEHPGLGWRLEGEQREQRESLVNLARSALGALLVIYALLAIPFRSYTQPLLVMSAIPFGAVGAVAGHVLLGYDLSVVSVLGLVALAGLVVNDSLVLINAANQLRRQGMRSRTAIVRAGARRFRPILLTSLTTFFGLMPMIFERSIQARFLVPMAISLGFGVLFATVVVLLLVPSLYLILEDIRYLFGVRETRPLTRPDPATEATP